MARRTKRVTATEGRDRGKIFTLKEMPADQGEAWAIRCLLALSRGGIDLPPGMFEKGFSSLAGVLPYILVIGLKSLHGAQWIEFVPLLDEMMACVRYQPPGTAPEQELFFGENSQIEEIATRIKLRQEVLELHLGFSMADTLSSSGDPEPPPAPLSA